MTKIKYPNLIAKFPDELVEEAIEAAEQGTEFFKEWMLEQCHEYAVGYLDLYHKYAMMQQLKIAYNLSKLENIEQIAEEMDDAESTETSQ